MKISTLVLTGIVLFFVYLPCSADQMSSVMIMLNSFGNCSINGAQSQRLTDAATKVTNILSVIQSSSECSSLRAVATKVQSSLDRMVNFDPQYSEEEKIFLGLKQRRDSLVLAVSSETDPAVRDTLKLDLQQAEADMASAKSDWIYSSLSHKTARFYDAARSYREGFNSMLDALVLNEQCMLKSPSLTQSLSQVGLGIAQSSTLAIATGGASLVAGVGLNTIAQINKFFQDRQNAIQLKKLSDPFVSLGISCALENLNEIYCDSHTSEKLLEYLNSNEFKVNREQNYPAFRGLDLIEKALPAFDRALANIKMGGDASTQDESLSRYIIKSSRTQFESVRSHFETSLLKLKRNIDSIDNNTSEKNKREQIFNFQKEFIKDFLNMSAVPDDGGSPNGSFQNNNTALAAIYKGQKARYYLLGFDPEKIVVGGTSNHIWFDDLRIEPAARIPPEQADAESPWVKYCYKGQTNHFIQNYDEFAKEVRSRFEEWFREAQSALDTKESTVLKTDKKMIIASFETPSTVDRKITPFIAMQSLSQYITNPANQKYLSHRYKKIASEVSTTLEEIARKINDISFDLTEEEFSKQAGKTFKEIIEITRYDEDSRYFINRLNTIINLIVNEAAIEVNQNGSPDVIRALASNDLVIEMKSLNGGSKENTNKYADYKGVKVRSKVLIKEFVDAFREPIEKILSNTNRNSADNVEKAHLCFQLLGYKSEDSDFNELIMKSCKNVSMPSLPNAVRSPVFTQALWNKPVDNRICTHQDWQRKLIIYDKGYN